MWTSSCSFFFFFFVVVLCRTARRTVRRSSVPTACNSFSSYTDKLLATPTPQMTKYRLPSFPLSQSLSHPAPRTVSLPSFFSEGLLSS